MDWETYKREDAEKRRKWRRWLLLPFGLMFLILLLKRILSVM